MNHCAVSSTFKVPAVEVTLQVQHLLLIASGFHFVTFYDISLSYLKPLWEPVIPTLYQPFKVGMETFI